MTNREPMAAMRVLIVDDEPLARRAIEILCRETTDVEIIGEADSGAAAIEAIQNQHPDVVFIDVELPDMTGFDALRTAQIAEPPLAIMVTAHSRYAVQSYDEAAFDFLTKPVLPERFAKAIGRARAARVDAGKARTTISSLPRPVNGTGSYTSPQMIVGERGRRLYPLNVEKVSYIQSEHNYVRIHAGHEEYISRDTLKRLALVLESAGFVRIERSLLLNIRAVEFAERMDYGVFAFTLTNGSRLESTSSYRADILRALRHGQIAGRPAETAVQ
jgi:two-component system, LytTR family, response regulator